MIDVHGSIWGGGTHVPQHMSHTHTRSLPVIALIPESGNPPHTSKLHGRDRRRLGFTMVSVPRNQSPYSLVRSLLLANRNPLLSRWTMVYTLRK